MNTSMQHTIAGIAFLGLAVVLIPRPAHAIPVFIDIEYTSVPGVGDSDISVSAFFDDAALTGIGTEAVTLSSLEATITSPKLGLSSAVFSLPNTDLLCRTFPGVACFSSIPYTANFVSGQFRGLSGVQGLHGTPIRTTNYPTNTSILFQLGFNQANSFGPLAQVRYARNEPVHDALQASHSRVTPVQTSGGVPAPEPGTGALLALGLLSARFGTMRRSRN